MEHGQNDRSPKAEHVQSTTPDEAGTPLQGSVEELKRGGFVAPRLTPNRETVVGVGCLGLVFVWIVAAVVFLAVLASGGNCLDNGYNCHETFDSVIGWMDIIIATLLSILIVVLMVRHSRREP